MSGINVNPNFGADNPRIDISNSNCSGYIHILNKSFEFATVPGNINLMTNATNRLQILNNGNIGINKSNPLYQLDVSGIINSNTLKFISTNIGFQAGFTNQQTNAVALGYQAGYATQGTYAIAMGYQAGYIQQGTYAIAIGYLAGNSLQGQYSVAMGGQAGQNTQAANAVAISNLAGQIKQGTQGVAIGNGAAQYTQGANAVAIGFNSGNTLQGTNSVAIGYQAGQSTQGSTAVSVAIGYQACWSGSNGYSIGYQAGYYAQTSEAISIGYQAGYTWSAASIAIGYQAGFTLQGNDGGGSGQFSVAIGYQAGQSQQRGTSIAIGNQACQVNQASYSIAIGNGAGRYTQYGYNIAIGNNAGWSYHGAGLSAIAIGNQAGYQSQGSGDGIAIGSSAGAYNQGGLPVAIGTRAGFTGQGNFGIAIGYNAGQTSQPANSFIINATTLTNINAPAVSSFVITPLRSGISTGNTVLVYNTTTFEIQSSSKTFVIPHPTKQSKYLVHACLEGPEVGVYYRGKGEIVNNISTVVCLPEYVDKIATDFTIQLTPIYGTVKCDEIYSSEVENGKFTVYGENGKFHWFVQGKRGNLDIEPDIDTTEVYGDGPYKWCIQK